MNEIKIRAIDSKSDIDKFLKFAWKIYEGNEYWVPPLLYEKKSILDKKKNPFFDKADAQLFVAERNSEIVGRIAAIRNDMHNEIHNEKVGFFGFFESINEQAVADKLLDTAAEWLRKNGMDSMRGPANLSSNDEWALLIEGFDDPPRIMMPYNPPYYIDLLENYGLKKAKDLYAWKIENQKLVKSEKLSRVAEIAKKRSGVKIRQLNLKDFKNELKIVKYLYNKAWEKNWGFVPMTDPEIDKMAKEMKPLVDPSLVLFAEHEDKPIGFALVIPDYNFIFKKMNGKLLPFNFLKLFTQKKKITWARVITLGFIPEFRKRGLDAVFYNEIVHRAAKKGIYTGEASWILEDNDMMNRGAKVMNAELYKRYRVYEKTI